MIDIFYVSRSETEIHIQITIYATWLFVSGLYWPNINKIYENTWYDINVSIISPISVINRYL